MNKHSRGIVSMLTSPDRTTLITDTGDMIVLENNSVYNIIAISSFLAANLTGTSVVQLDLEDYIKPVVDGLDLGDGIAITQIIEGKEVQGIFYPVARTSVTVEVGGEVVEVPNVENLRKHIDRATEEQSPSIKNFLKRIAPVLKDRLHSGEDLMTFINQSELPLTNDGRIIAYKKVYMVEPGIFVDCHTKKIRQRVGSRVQMDISMVDPNRNRSCSHGLHVCNLGYLSGFGGNYTLITLVDPADFIAVPRGEDTKARVRSYDIIGAIASDELDTFKETLEKLISAAIDGKAIQPNNLVTIKPGGNIHYDPLHGGSPVPPISVVRSASGKSLAPTKVKATTGMDNLVKRVKAMKKGTVLPPTLVEQARTMYMNAEYAALRAFKKAKKKSWSTLGFDQTAEDRILKS